MIVSFLLFCFFFCIRPIKIFPLFIGSYVCVCGADNIWRFVHVQYVKRSIGVPKKEPKKRWEVSSPPNSNNLNMLNKLICNKKKKSNNWMNVSLLLAFCSCWTDKKPNWWNGEGGSKPCVQYDACQLLELLFSIAFMFFATKVHFVGTERSHRDKINKLLTYEAENCRPFYMQTLPASEGTSWNIKMRQRMSNKSWTVKFIQIF